MATFIHIRRGYKTKQNYKKANNMHSKAILRNLKMVRYRHIDVELYENFYLKRVSKFAPQQ